MINNAWDWAERHNKLRKNEVHGEWEAKIVLDDQFKFKEAEGFDSEQSTSMAVEVPWPTLCTHYMHLYVFPFCGWQLPRNIIEMDWTPWIEDRDGAFFEDQPFDITAPDAELTAHVRDGNVGTPDNAALSKSVSFKLLSRKKN